MQPSKRRTTEAAEPAAPPPPTNVPAPDAADLTPAPSMSQFLASHPLERDGARRRHPMSERYVRYVLSRLRAIIQSTDAFVGEGQYNVVVRVLLKSEVHVAMRFNKLSANEADQRRTATLHVLMERLRELYPRQMDNVVQLVDYQLLSALDVRAILKATGTASSNSIDESIETPRLAMLFEPLEMSLESMLQEHVVHASADVQLVFLSALLAQVFAQLHYLQLMMPQFNHNDLHAGNVMVCVARETALGADSDQDLVYPLETGAGMMGLGPEGTRERLRDRITIRVPLGDTAGRLAKLIDLDLAYVHYLPRDDADTDVVLARVGVSERSSERQYLRDARNLVTDVALKFEAALDAARVEHSKSALTELQALLGRIHIHHQPQEYQSGAYALGQLLLRDPMFASFRAPDTKPTWLPPVFTHDADSKGRVLVERIRSELAAIQ